MKEAEGIEKELPRTVARDILREIDSVSPLSGLRDPPAHLLQKRKNIATCGALGEGLAV